jgi:hypothetical protein
MNCADPVRERLPTPLIRPSLPPIKPLRWRWCSHTQRSEEPYMSVRKEGHEFRNNLVRQGTLHSA